MTGKVCNSSCIGQPTLHPQIWIYDPKPTGKMPLKNGNIDRSL
jgi:hypothetical protein